MATTAQKVRLSIFLIISSTVLLLFFIGLVGNRLLKRMDIYNIEYQDISVTGLEPGSAVKFHGVQVGRVSGLAVKDAATVIVEIEVERDTPVKMDTEAILTLVGITGLKFVELIGGSMESEDLPPRGTIIAGQSLFENISGRAEVILGKLEQVLNNINQMTGQETTDSINKAINSIASLSTELDMLLKDNRQSLTNAISGLENVMYNLTTTTEKVDSTMTVVNNMIRSEEIKSTVTNINHITGKLRSDIENLRLVETSESLRELLQSANKMVINYDLLATRARDDILESLRNLEDTLENLRETTDVIRENPSILLRGRQTTGDRVE